MALSLVAVAAGFNGCSFRTQWVGKVVYRPVDLGRTAFAQYRYYGGYKYIYWMHDGRAIDMTANNNYYFLAQCGRA